MRTLSALIGLAALLAACQPRAGAVEANDIGGLEHRREEVFAFSQRPTFKEVGKDRYEIAFASQGACDATVSILDGEGKVVRHLVSGVLGPNAPAPFAKGALDQKIIWDGKDDFERYVTAPKACRVRVALGLKPVFDKILMWHPNRFTGYTHALACDKDGVYVLNAEHNPDTGTEHASSNRTLLAAYDHEGNYRRTLMPFRRDAVKLEACPRSPMEGQGEPAAGQPVPQGKSGPPYALVLGTGKTILSPTQTGSYYESLFPNSLIALDGQLWGIMWKEKVLQLFRIGTDGSMPAEGFYSQGLGAMQGYGPCWMAPSPDGKWLYLNISASRQRDLHKGNSWRYKVESQRDKAAHVLHRIPRDLSAGATQPYLGEQGKPGKDAAHFSFPEGLACDAQGRLFVADRGNDRIQVFSTDGKHVKSIAVESPVQAAIHPKSGALYVLSHPGAKKSYRLLKYAGLESAKPEAELAFKTESEYLHILPTFCLDTWAKEDTVWITNPRGHIELYADKGKSFELKRSLFEDLKKEWKGELVHEMGLGVLAADPLRPHLYVNDSRTGAPANKYGKSPRIDTETGEITWVPAVTAFGMEGLAYLRDGNQVKRFEPMTGRPVAFDYGSGDDGILSYRFSSSDGIGFGVSPRGEVVFHDRWPPVPGLMFKHSEMHIQTQHDLKLPPYMQEEKWTGGKGNSLSGYQVRQSYPGRIYKGSGALLLYNAFGELVNNDLLPGVPRLASGVQRDRDGNIYVGVPMQKLVNGKELLGLTLAKFPPTGGRFVVSGKGVPVPLQELPKRPPDFRPMGRHPLHDDFGPNGEAGYGEGAWGENMSWSFGGYFPFNTVKCVCLNTRFELDHYARSFVPESFRQSISVMDTNGNFILRLGGYGNADDRGPEIRFAYMRYLTVTDKRLYVNDVVNRRIVSVDLAYEQEAEAELK